MKFIETRKQQKNQFFSHSIYFNYFLFQAREEENDPNARARRKQQEEEAAKERDAFLAADLMGGSFGSGDAIGYGIADDVPRSGASESAPVVSAADLRPVGTRLEDVTLTEDAECEKVASMLVKKIVEFPVS